MLTEARIILPIEGGTTLLAPHTAHTSLKSRLMKAFGGYTCYSVHGAWRDPNTGEVLDDASVAYDIVCDPTDELTAPALRKIAGIACNAMMQRCVYLRLPNGNVEFVPNPGNRRAHQFAAFDFAALLTI